MKYLLFSLLILTSCAGYRLEGWKNPFEQYGIRSIAIPSFINRTSLPNVSGHFSREISLALSQYPGLKILPGEASSADAILIGILTSADKREDVFKTSSRIYTTGALEDSIGDRANFYVPSSTRIRMNLQIVLIKDPTFTQKELAKHNELSELVQGPQIIVNRKFNLTGSFSRTLKGGTGGNTGKSVNFTSNHGLANRTVKQMAENAANQFKETVANAF